ncbi:hypothetical protein VNI00_012694 [Paramarasmius palmivorus]|uniref:Protein kinase domain-containing protein n=1 Tax=Paramarasmius palmivorus TaxID=297713 RepID=A0AAW0C7K5_9AGAR
MGSDSDALDKLNLSENTALDAVVSAFIKKNYLARFVETHYQIGVENPQASKAVPTLTLRCQNCNHIVNLPPADSRWYCVTRGLRIGYVRGWDAVKKLVLHVAENKYAAYTNRETARKAFIVAVANREANVVVTGEYAMAYDPLPDNATSIVDLNTYLLLPNSFLSVTLTDPHQASISDDDDDPVQEYVRLMIFYAGIVRTIHISSVPWILPGDPPCPIHGPKHLDTPSLDPQNPTIPDPHSPINVRHMLFGDTSRLPPTFKVAITAKVSIPEDAHLKREAGNYEKFPEAFGEHWSGFNLAYPLHDPTPCGAIVPAFYGFYTKVGDEGKETYFSPLLLLEDCGDPIDPSELNLDDRHECSALLFRFHHHGWIHGSFYPRNILMRRGDHADYPMEKNHEDKRFRLIDFGRSRYLEDLAEDDERGRDEWDKDRFKEKNTVWHTMELPFPI